MFLLERIFYNYLCNNYNESTGCFFSTSVSCITGLFLSLFGGFLAFSKKESKMMKLLPWGTYLVRA